MKSYQQFCPLSRALDVIGDRWTMLVIRELLISPSRYNDLQKALPGIATNLLAQRLRTLEDAGVVSSADEPAPVSSRVYSLTDWGRALQAPLVEIARWGTPLMSKETGSDRSKGRWLVFAITALYPDPNHMPGSAGFPELTARIDADGDSLLLVSDESGARAKLSTKTAMADVVIEGTADEVFRTLAGDQSDRPKTQISGDADAIRRFFELTSHAFTAQRDLSA